MKFLASHLRAFGFNESTLPVGAVPVPPDETQSGFAPCSVTNRSGALTQFEDTQQRIPSREEDIVSVV